MKVAHLVLLCLLTFHLLLSVVVAQTGFQDPIATGLKPGSNSRLLSDCDDSGTVHVLTIEGFESLSIFRKNLGSPKWESRVLADLDYAQDELAFHMSDNGHGCLIWGKQGIGYVFTRGPGGDWVQAAEIGKEENEDEVTTTSYFDCAVNNHGEVLAVWGETELNSVFKNSRNIWSRPKLPGISVLISDEEITYDLFEVTDLHLILTDESVGQLFVAHEDRYSDLDIYTSRVLQLLYEDGKWSAPSTVLPWRKSTYDIGETSFDPSTNQGVVIMEATVDQGIDSTVADAGVYLGSFKASFSPNFSRVSSEFSQLAGLYGGMSMASSAGSVAGQFIGAGISYSHTADGENLQCLMTLHDQGSFSVVSIPGNFQQEVGSIAMDIAVSSQGEIFSTTAYSDSVEDLSHLIGSVSYDGVTESKELILESIKPGSRRLNPDSVSVAACPNGGATFLYKSQITGELISVDYLSPDLCPLDSEKLGPGVCGCGIADVDANSNGIIDCRLNSEAKALIRSLRTAVKRNKTVAKKLARNLVEYVEEHRSEISLTESNADLVKAARQIQKLTKKNLRLQTAALKIKALKSLNRLDKMVADS